MIIIPLLQLLVINYARKDSGATYRATVAADRRRQHETVT